MMTDQSAKPILTPAQALSRYHEHLHLHLDGERMGLLPGVIGTVFFDGGSRPDGRQAILDCFDRFDALFGSHLRGGKDTDTGKFSKRNAAGVEKIRRAIQDTPSYLSVSVIRSSATDQDTAAEYNVQVLTSMANPEDYVSPQGWTAPKGQESGLSMLKFNVPMALVTTADGLALYEGFLRFVCERLNADGEGRPTCFIGVRIVHTGSKCTGGWRERWTTTGCLCTTGRAVTWMRGLCVHETRHGY
jgi:hypothetical protein